MPYAPGNPYAIKPGEVRNPWGFKGKAAANAASDSIRECELLARQYCPEAILVAVKIMSDLQAPPSSRLRAVEIVLERGLGAPQQTVNVNTDTAELSDDALSRLITDHLAAAIAASFEAESQAAGVDAGAAPPGDPTKLN